MVNAQEWFDEKYPTAESKRVVETISRKIDFRKRIEYNLISVFSESRPLSSLLLGLDDMRNRTLSENLILEGPLTLKGFPKLEILDISKHKITSLNISDFPELRELSCYENQLTNLSISGSNKIEKIFCCGNKLSNLEFLKSLNPVKLLTFRMANNNFPEQDLKCFTPFVNLHRLIIPNNPKFHGSLKPLRNLTDLRVIDIAGTNIDSGLEYLPDEFFNVNAVASNLNVGRGYYLRILSCTGKLAEQLKDYKVENDPFRTYDWQAWRQDNQELIKKAKEETEDIEELNEMLEWEMLSKEIKELYEHIRCNIYLKTNN